MLPLVVAFTLNLSLSLINPYMKARKLTVTFVQPSTPGKMVQPNQGGSRKISFNISDQYDIQDVIGEGAYGVVW